MSYELREHTADVAVEATASTLGGVFAAVGDGMAGAMCDEIPDAKESGGERQDLTVTAEGREALLFDYLDELIYERDIRTVLPVDNEGSVEEHEGEWTFTGSYRGLPLSAVDARDLKAVTYADMDITQTDAGWRAYVVFDV